MSIYKILSELSNDFTIEAAPLDDKQKTKVNKWQAPHHSFSDKAMGGADKHRVEIPLKQHDLIAPKHIVKALGEAGYKEVNYTKGLVKDQHGRDVKIGRALAKAGKHAELKDYENDKQRAAIGQHKIVISRHPHDVAGMSTNQGWTSCMNMKGGAYSSDLKDEIWNGTHVAYLVHKDDHNLNHPVARIALKPFENEHGKKVLHPESKTYGTSNSSFHKTVSAWAKKHFPTKDSVYLKNDDVYDDDGEELIGTGTHKEYSAIKHYKNGKLHRDGNLPAVEYKNGNKYYYKNGKVHRDGDLPALEFNNGDKEYYKNGKLYRDGDKPAIERNNGDKEYYKNGKRHREGDLPAVETRNNLKEYYKNGKLHRDGDLPAIERKNYKAYYKNGKKYTPKYPK